MAVKKVTSRKRSTTKRSKTTRATAKRATQPRSTPEAESVDQASTVQRHAATEQTTDERPSRFTGDHYMHATGPQPEDGSVRRPGKWLIFVSRSRIDGLWETVRRAVEAGRLGHAAKVSTALPDPLSPDPKKHVIWVYTGNEDDPVDVRRVRDALRQLGVSWKIPYKSDATTGDPAAKYYE
jgi:hypothetical protein